MLTLPTKSTVRATWLLLSSSLLSPLLLVLLLLPLSSFPLSLFLSRRRDLPPSPPEKDLGGNASVAFGTMKMARRSMCSRNLTVVSKPRTIYEFFNVATLTPRVLRLLEEKFTLVRCWYKCNNSYGAPWLPPVAGRGPGQAPALRFVRQLEEFEPGLHARDQRVRREPDPAASAASPQSVVHSGTCAPLPYRQRCFTSICGPLRYLRAALLPPALLHLNLWSTQVLARRSLTASAASPQSVVHSGTCAPLPYRQRCFTSICGPLRYLRAAPLPPALLHLNLWSTQVLARRSLTASAASPQSVIHSGTCAPLSYRQRCFTSICGPLRYLRAAPLPPAVQYQHYVAVVFLTVK